MILVVRLIATLVDAGFMLGIAALLSLLAPVLAALRDGVAPPPLRQPWDDLVKLGRKRRLRPGFASPLYPAWPIIALSASAALVLIVPGFAFGLITAPLATVPMLGGLLALALGARQAARLESGAGLRGARAGDAARRQIIALVVWLVVLGALAVRAGSDGLGAIGGVLATTPANAALVGFAGVALALSVGGFDLSDPGDYAGPELALFRLEAMLRRAVLVSVLVDLVAPLPMADTLAVASWPVGLLAWIGKMMVLGVVLVWIAPRRAALGVGVVAAAGVVVVLVVQVVPGPTLLIGAGLIVSVVGLIVMVRRGSPVDAAAAVQCGFALVGFGLGVTDGAMLILVTLGLARLASSAFPALGLLALLGLPPFGGFAGDVAVLRAGFDLGLWFGGVMLVLLLLTIALALARYRATGFTWPPARRAVPAGLLLTAALAFGVMPWLIAVTP
jgi:formate hydrogenlyase subunit 4